MIHITPAELAVIIDIAGKLVTFGVACTGAWQAYKANKKTEQNLEVSRGNREELCSIKDQVDGRMSQVLEKVPNAEKPAAIGSLEDVKKEEGPFA